MASTLKTTQIRADGGTQPRAMLDGDTVDTYCDDLKNGATFPPVVVFYDGTTHWLADGFHRFYAHNKAMVTSIVADVRQGTRRDAVLYSVGANATHGKPRTNADKRRAVSLLLGDEEWSRRADAWIAEKCGVSQPFVGKVRAETQPITVIGSETREGRDGKTRSLPTRPAAPRQTSLAVAAPEPEEPGPDRRPVAHPVRPAAFICGACGESFDREVWHCTVCHHHWPNDRARCNNCHGHAAISPDDPKPAAIAPKFHSTQVSALRDFTNWLAAQPAAFVAHAKREIASL